MLPSHDDYKTVSSTNQRKPFPWQAFGLVMALLLMQFTPNLWVYERSAIAHGEYWRLWTGNWVHTNYAHLWLNLAGFLLLGVMQPRLMWHRRLSLVIFLLGWCVGIGLWFFSPDVQWYVGFSGVLYGLYWLAGMDLWREGARWSAVVVLVGICGKTGWDMWHTTPSFSATLIQAPIIYAAHIYGMGGAIVLDTFLNRKSINP